MRPLIAGNWKMNLSVEEGCALAATISSTVGVHEGADVLVLPPYPHLWPVAHALTGTGIAVGAQDISAETSGAFTGEVGASMIAPVCSFALVGHSERRHQFGESNELVGRKLVRAVDQSLSCILAVGETLEEREGGRTRDVMRGQLEAALASFETPPSSEIVIAYEPVWAIGTGRTPAPEDAEMEAAWIRAWYAHRFGIDGAGVRILYGGSMTPENALSLLKQPDINGGLIGGASLHATSFCDIISAALQIEARP